MDEYTKKRILMDDKTKHLILVEKFDEFAGQMGEILGYSVGTAQGWSGP